MQQMRALRDVEGEKGEGLREFAKLAKAFSGEGNDGVEEAEAG